MIVGPNRRQDESEACVPSADATSESLNSALSSNGEGFILQLCPSQTYILNSPLIFRARSQEISTQGYPEGDTRASLILSGTGQTVVVQGTCNDCDGIRLMNVILDGARNSDTPISSIGANIQFGGDNSDQLVSNVVSRNTRGWTCLHVSEGSKGDCRNATILNNDIGPCGTSEPDEWSDGISVSCRDSTIDGNTIDGATDGGITIIGTPGVKVRSNTVRLGNYTMRAGIKMTSYLPNGGNYRGTEVYDNTILGGFSDQPQEGIAQTGANSQGTLTKIGIAIGPRIWSNSVFSSSTIISSGVIRSNHLSGAFTYRIAIASSENFTLANNELTGEHAFIGGERSGSCPDPAFVVVDEESNSILDDSNQKEITMIVLENDSEAGLVDCISPPSPTEEIWPFRSAPPQIPGATELPDYPIEARSTGEKIAMGVCIPIGVIIFFVAIWLVRRWAVKNQIAKRISKRLSQASKRLSSLLA